ncbi:ABC transporter permease [Flavilitoribacter nigricans DSM 23189 = NBRC 102662]|uniref:ABC transporter permease n=2 Tax=Flavilitoribacter TaxID=2762562 RepID=A0A2D0NAI6_FLAN2|nr:ABC transporter permease [Flavilitoribacter nigricans DSM 23189 = NBRC 102662]
MFKNNLKIAWRGLFKNRSYSLINIGGLALAMLVPILIGLWIHDELNNNRQFPNSDRLAFVMQNQTMNGQISTWWSEAWQLEPALEKDHGDLFENVITITGSSNQLLRYNDKKVTKNGRFMGAEVTEMLSLNFLQGTRSALEDQNSVVLSASAAEALFGTEDPMGKSIILGNDLAVTINGVYEDLPENSTFGDLEFIGPWKLNFQHQNLEERAGWGNSWFNTLVQIAENTTMEQVSAQIKDVKYNSIDPEFAAISKPQLWLHPMERWHLYSQFENGASVGGRIEYVRMFGIIGIFVLLLGCINFMNLSTARSEKRAREVGIRKTLGSLRAQLVSQFFSESVLIASIAFVLAFILAVVLLPPFNEVAGKKLGIPWSNPWFWMLGIGFTLLTGIIAGSYPALYLSGFRPVKVLKGTFRLGRFSALPRKILVVIQFTVSVVLIIGTIFIFRQIEFAKDRPIGYNRDNLVRVPIKNRDIITHWEALRTDLLNTSKVENMVGTDSPVTSTGVTNGGFTWDGMDPGLSNDFTSLRVTYDFGDMVDWEIIEGRDFSRDFATDSSAIILNEAAVEYMGLENPVGTIMERGDMRHEIVGVVKNLITQSPYDPVRQTLFMHHETWLNQINIKLKPDSRAHEALSQIETIFKKYDPVNAFEYHFADEEYARKFQNEERIGELATFFALLAVIISCLGLFGLASYVAEQRTKEIGIRKVLGATVTNLWQLLSKDFIFLVLIACILAVPLAWLLMNNWLEDFSYRTDLSWWVFAVVGLLAMILALLTVSFQALRAAFMNPVNSIKSE